MVRRTVVVADDDDDLRALLALRLRSYGHRVVEIRDGAELLELVANRRRKKPDVLVVDVLMPCYSGIGVLAALRGAGIDIPVIVITARPDGGIVRDACRLGALAVLHKPFDPSLLHAAILSATSVARA